MTDWCKLGANFYRDPAVMRAGEPAELLFVRGLAYCAEQGTDRIPFAAIPLLTSTKGALRADALVRERLWLIDGEDYVVRSWSHWQEGRDAVEVRRRKDRERKAAKARQVKASPPNVRGSSAETSAEFRTPEIEVEKEVEEGLRPSLAVVPTQTRRDVLWDAVMDACRVDASSITKSKRGGYAKAVAELRAVGATPDDVHRVADNYRLHFRDAALTPNALATQWAQCQAAPASRLTLSGDRMAGHYALIEHLGDQRPAPGSSDRKVDQGLRLAERLANEGR